MGLILSVLRCPDHAVPETKRLAGGELCIGRDALRASWVLPDPTQQISRQHCVVRFDNGAWQVQDLSSNGTFLNQEPAPLGQGTTRALKDGDRIRVGPYEIEAHVEAPAHAKPPPPPPEPYEIKTPEVEPFEQWGGSLFPEHPAGTEDPFGTSAGDAPLFGQGSKAEPADFLDSAPDVPPHGTTPDHTPSFTDAFAPARPLLADDWAKEFEFQDPFGQSAPPEPRVEIPPPDPFVRVASLDPIVPRQTEPRAQSAPPGDSALLAAFMAGAGLPDLAPQDPLAAMREAGAAFRAFVTGLREVLIVRAEVKDTMGIDKTYIRARGNNPLKFAAGDDDALTALLGTGRRTGMAPADAVREALRDIRRHEQASLPAMQAAVRALLAQLDPEKLRAASDGGGIALPAQRRARAWDKFEAEYARLTAALGDDFDAVFGRRFAEEYERIVTELRAGETPP
jgi:type VI secretion system protein ImpI/type VI secretion system protein